MSRAADILALLSDGVPRTKSEIAEALSSEDFIARREASRTVDRTLTELRRGETVERLQIGFEVRPGEYRYVEKFIDARSVVPVCLACWHRHWPGKEPLQVTGNPAQLCTICRRRTNDGAVAPRMEAEAAKADQDQNVNSKQRN